MRNLISKLSDILPKQDKIRLGILFLMMFGAGALQLLGLSLILGFISILSDADNVLSNPQLQSLWNFLNITSFDDLLIWGSAALAFIFLIKSAYLVFYNYILSRFAHNKFRNIASDLFTSYMLMPYHFHLQHNSAELIRNVTNETRMLLKFVLIPLLTIAMETVMVIAVLLFLLVIEPVVTIMAGISVGLTGFILIKILKRYEQHYGKLAQESRGKMIQYVSEGISGIKEINILNRHKFFIERLWGALEIQNKQKPITKLLRRALDLQLN